MATTGEVLFFLCTYIVFSHLGFSDCPCCFLCDLVLCSVGVLHCTYNGFLLTGYDGYTRDYRAGDEWLDKVKFILSGHLVTHLSVLSS